MNDYEDSSIDEIKKSGKSGRKRNQPEKKDVEEKSDSAVSADETESAVTAELPELNEVQQRIYSALSGEKVHIEVLAQTLETDPAGLMTELTELEILGVVRQLPGKTFELCI